MALPRQPSDKATTARLVAELRQAARMPCAAGAWALAGLVFGDAAKRFDDGEPIVTSPVLKVRPTTRGLVCETKHTRYVVTSWLAGERPEIIRARRRQ